MYHPNSSLPESPGPLWRLGSTAVMGLTGVLCKAFLYGLNTVETHGLDNFLRILDERRGPGRKRGLVTACNHISVLDDPLMWGVLPLRYAFDPWSLRWGLGAHDICFKNSFTATFFGMGQVLPTYRLKHSPLGGINQPTVTEAIHLLSGRPAIASKSPITKSPITTSSSLPASSPLKASSPPPHPHSHLSWVHVFPEGCVHQHPTSSLRYFKWGVSRLILESDPTPAFLPIFIDGTQHLMPEDRTFPRFLPRIFKRIRVVFGEEVDVRRVFGDQIDRWNEIKHRVRPDNPAEGDVQAMKEAVGIQIEVARRARNEVMKVRKSLGYPDDDEALGRAETWAREKHEKPKTTRMDGEHVSTKR